MIFLFLFFSFLILHHPFSFVSTRMLQGRCMRYSTRHAAQLLGVHCFFIMGYYFRSITRWLEIGEGWDDFRLWLCSAKWWRGGHKRD